MFSFVAVLGFLRSGLVKLIANPRILLAIVVVLAALYAYWQISSKRTEILELQLKIHNLETEIKVKEIEKRNAIAAQKALSEELLEQEKQNMELDKALEGIRNAPEEEDGPVADVLRRELAR